MKQTDSEYPSVRGWGCYLCTLAYMAGVRDISVVDNLFMRLIRDGHIADNQIPTSKPGWYRCFILRPDRVVEAFARELGVHVVAKELSRHPHNPEPSSKIDGFFVIKEVPGHFGLIYPEQYNPDPRYPINVEGKSYRVWSVGKC